MKQAQIPSPRPKTSLRREYKNYVIGSGEYQCSNKQVFELNLPTDLETHVYLFIYFMYLFNPPYHHTPIKSKEKKTVFCVTQHVI